MPAADGVGGRQGKASIHDAQPYVTNVLIMCRFHRLVCRSVLVSLTTLLLGRAHAILPYLGR